MDLIEFAVDAGIVMPGAASDSVPFPISREKSILATPSGEVVSTSVADKPIAAPAARQRVAAALAVENVIALITNEIVVATPTVENIVAVVTSELHSIPEPPAFEKGADVDRLSAKDIVSASATNHFHVSLDQVPFRWCSVVGNTIRIRKDGAPSLPICDRVVVRETAKEILAIF